MSAGTIQSKKSILVVDDEPDVRTTLEAILTPAGYSVTTACDGQAALDVLTNKEFDLMILDLIMPGLTGKEVLEQLRYQGRLAEMPVVVLTAVLQGKEVRRGQKRGIAFYVTKPFNNTTIKELARYLLDVDLTEEQKEDILLKLLSKTSSL